MYAPYTDKTLMQFSCIQHVEYVYHWAAHCRFAEIINIYSNYVGICIHGKN